MERAYSAGPGRRRGVRLRRRRLRRPGAPPSQRPVTGCGRSRTRRGTECGPPGTGSLKVLRTATSGLPGSGCLGLLWVSSASASHRGLFIGLLWLFEGVRVAGGGGLFLRELRVLTENTLRGRPPRGVLARPSVVGSSSVSARRSAPVVRACRWWRTWTPPPGSSSTERSFPAGRGGTAQISTRAGTAPPGSVPRSPAP